MLTAPSTQPGYLIATIVEHVDVDSQRVVHFSRYVSLIETATIAFLEGRGAMLSDLEADGFQAKVRELRMHYRSSATLGERLLLSCRLARIAIASMSFDVEITKADADLQPGVLVASGFLNMVLVQSSTGRPVPLPKSLVMRMTNHDDRA